MVAQQLLGEIYQDPDTGRIICHLCARAMHRVSGGTQVILTVQRDDFITGMKA
jgi:hypothetical protein